MSFLDSLMAGLALVGNVEAFLALGIGVAIGVVGGAIPGMSATMAVALTLPFTFTMTPITGILLLLGVYKGGIFGGSIPAILIKTPARPPPRRQCSTAIRWPKRARRAGRLAWRSGRAARRT